MRKLAFITTCILVLAAFAAAQTYSGNSVGGLKGMDVLGAHNDAGRGCAGCHAPHSGAAGGGGNAATNAAKFNDPQSGDLALFGQDLTPLYGATLAFGGGSYSETLPANLTNQSLSGEIVIAMCLSCHDGEVAKGGMMVGTSYEGRMGLLPANIYGPNPIPTLLNTTGQNYENDHPVGLKATLKALHVVNNSTDTTQLTIVMGAVNNTTGLASINSITPTAGSTYAAFVANYGIPALEGSSHGYGLGVNPASPTDPSTLFITCTTCHNQHNMYVYISPGKITSKIQNGVYPTYWFINGPYNPSAGDTISASTAPSTTQFCRQCHIGESNEAAGVTNVATQF